MALIVGMQRKESKLLNMQLVLHTSLMPSQFSQQCLTSFVTTGEQDAAALGASTAIYYSFPVTVHN